MALKILPYCNNEQKMCRISRGTVFRANKRTIDQSRDIRLDFSERSGSLPQTFNISVSFMGRSYTSRISAEHIKESFDKAWKRHGE